MFRITDILQPSEGEHVLHVARKHVATMFPRLLLAAVLIVLPFFFLFGLTDFGTWGVVAFAGSVALGLFIALRAFLLWDADVFVLTSYRVVDVDQRSLLSRSVAEIPLTHIHDVRWLRQGWNETVWRMGTLRIRATGATTQLMIPKLAYPERLASALEMAREKIGSRGIVDRMADLLDQADGKALDAIDRIVHEKRHG